MLFSSVFHGNCRSSCPVSFVSTNNLAIDVSSTNIVLGVFDGQTLVQSGVARRCASGRPTSSGCGRTVRPQQIERVRIRGVILGSVVPPLTRTSHDGAALRRHTRSSTGVNTSMPISREPAEVGADPHRQRGRGVGEFGGEWTAAHRRRSGRRRRSTRSVERRVQSMPNVTFPPTRSLRAPCRASTSESPPASSGGRQWERWVRAVLGLSGWWKGSCGARATSWAAARVRRDGQARRQSRRDAHHQHRRRPDLRRESCGNATSRRRRWPSRLISAQIETYLCRKTTGILIRWSVRRSTWCRRGPTGRPLKVATRIDHYFPLLPQGAP